MDMLEVDEFWADLREFEMCMLVTRDGPFLRSRPMKTHYFDDDGTVRFLTSIDAHKVEELAENPAANLVFQNPDDNTWISVSGNARISVDRADIDQVWHEDADPWFPGGKDEAAVLIVEPDIAEYWTFPESQLQAKWELLKGELTGAPPDLGENRKLEL